MKKILGLLGAIGLVASTGATSVVSCGSPKNDSGTDKNSEISALTKKWDGMTFDDFFAEFDSKVTFVSEFDTIKNEDILNFLTTISTDNVVPDGTEEAFKNIFTADNLQYINYFIDRCNKDGKTTIVDGGLGELQNTLQHLKKILMVNLKNVTKDTFLQNLYDNWNPVLQKAKFTGGDN